MEWSGLSLWLQLLGATALLGSGGDGWHQVGWVWNNSCCPWATFFTARVSLTDVLSATLVSHLCGTEGCSHCRTKSLRFHLAVTNEHSDLRGRCWVFQPLQKDVTLWRGTLKPLGCYPDNFRGMERRNHPELEGAFSLCTFIPSYYSLNTAFETMQ